LSPTPLPPGVDPPTVLMMPAESITRILARELVVLIQDLTPILF